MYEWQYYDYDPDFPALTNELPVRRGVSSSMTDAKREIDFSRRIHLRGLA